MTLFLSLLSAALFTHAAAEALQLQHRLLFERFRLSASTRRAPPSAPPLPAVALESRVQPLASAVVCAIPLATTRQTLAPTFTAPPMSDLGMRGRCVCSAYALHRQLFSETATCSACARTWLAVGTRLWFVPIDQLQAHVDAARGAAEELS